MSASAVREYDRQNLYYKLSICDKSLNCYTQEYEPPSGELKEAIDRHFGGLEGLKSKFNPAAAAIQVMS